MSNNEFKNKIKEALNEIKKEEQDRLKDKEKRWKEEDNLLNTFIEKLEKKIFKLCNEIFKNEGDKKEYEVIVGRWDLPEIMVTWYDGDIGKNVVLLVKVNIRNEDPTYFLYVEWNAWTDSIEKSLNNKRKRTRTYLNNLITISEKGYPISYFEENLEEYIDLNDTNIRKAFAEAVKFDKNMLNQKGDKSNLEFSSLGYE